MKRAFTQTVHEVKIKWSKPKNYTKALQTENNGLEDSYFYKIIAHYKDSFKLLYIGMSYSQYPSKRLSNRDHVNKREHLQNLYKRHELLISYGHIITLDNVNFKLIDEIESLLIYSHTDLPHLTNKKKVWSYKITSEYQIKNTGFRKDGMAKDIGLGVFMNW